MDWKEIWQRAKWSFKSPDEPPLAEKVFRSFLSDRQRWDMEVEENRRKLAASIPAPQPMPPPFDLYSLPTLVRYGHTHVLAEPGGGKSSLLEELILHDLESEYRPTVVVVDSQGDLIKKLLRLDLPEDPVYISPKNPPAINVFRAGQNANAAIETLLYLFSAQLLDPSGRMTNVFKPLCRLMFNTGGSLYDMLEYLRRPDTLKEATANVDEFDRKFILEDMLAKGGSYGETVGHLKVRLHALTNTPELRPFFSSKESSLDFYKLLNSRKLILVDTDKAALGMEPSKMFGRIFISLFVRAALERVKIEEKFRTASFLYCDEAHEYFDAKTEQILTETRKYKLGCILAHQRLSQCSADLKDALLGARIKLATYLNANDRDMMERAMELDPKLTRISTTPYRFTCNVKGIAHYEHVETTKDILESRPQRKDFDAFMLRNAARMRSSDTKKEERNITSEVDNEDKGAWHDK